MTTDRYFFVRKYSGSKWTGKSQSFFITFRVDAFDNVADTVMTVLNHYFESQNTAYGKTEASGYPVLFFKVR